MLNETKVIILCAISKAQAVHMQEQLAEKMISTGRTIYQKEGMIIEGDMTKYFFKVIPITFNSMTVKGIQADAIDVTALTEHIQEQLNELLKTTSRATKIIGEKIRPAVVTMR